MVDYFILKAIHVIGAVLLVGNVTVTGAWSVYLCCSSMACGPWSPRRRVRRRSAGLVLLLWFTAPAALAAQGQPAWDLSREAKNGFADLWDGSVASRREAVACLGGWLEGDTVHVTRVQPLELSASDSLTAGSEESLARCGPPEWIGTVHTHIRSTDDDQPSAFFSAGDRNVMSAWSARWGAQGAFCLLHGDGIAKCEVYPPGLPLRPRQP